MGGAEQMLKRLRCGGNALLDGGSNHAGEGREGMGPAFVLGAMRNFSGNHRRPQRPFGPVVGRFHLWLVEEGENPSLIVLPTDSVQQALVVGILEPSHP